MAVGLCCLGCLCVPVSPASLIIYSIRNPPSGAPSCLLLAGKLRDSGQTPSLPPPLLPVLLLLLIYSCGVSSSKSAPPRPLCSSPTSLRGQQVRKGPSQPQGSPSWSTEPLLWRSLLTDSSSSTLAQAAAAAPSVAAFL